MDGRPIALSYFSCWNLAKNADWNDASRTSFQREVHEIVKETRSHPSIIAYVVSHPSHLQSSLDLMSAPDSKQHL